MAIMTADMHFKRVHSLKRCTHVTRDAAKKLPAGNQLSGLAALTAGVCMYKLWFVLR